MKPEQLYQELKDLSEKIGIPVCEQNLKISGIHVNSGFCRVKNQPLFILDKRKSLAQKIEILSAWLAAQNLDSIYVVPAVREHLEG